MKFTIRTPRPRNPLVAAARFRQAGAHQPSGKAQRQAARHALRRELSASARWHSPP